jgi:hypothetical protein
MNKKTLSLPFLALLSLFAALPAHAVKGRPTVITYDDVNTDRMIWAFVKGDNNRLVSNHFDGTSWTWIDHGVPDGSVSISNPKAVTYIDSNGNRRIYVFAVDNTGHLVIRYHKGPGFTWQWSKQGGPSIVGSSLSATTFEDDNGARRLYAFAFSGTPGAAAPFKLVKHFWNGSEWNWGDMYTYGGQPYNNSSFTEVTNYVGNDGRRRMDVFCVAGDSQVMLRHSWVDAIWDMTNLGSLIDTTNASAINYINSGGYRTVHAFVRNHAYETIWLNYGSSWNEIGKPSGVDSSSQGLISATVYKPLGGYPRINVFVEWDKHLYLRSQVNLSWQPWIDLGRPSGTATSSNDGVKNTTAITYAEEISNTQNTMVFMTGAQDDRLYLIWWNGSSWQWYDRGTNP